MKLVNITEDVRKLAAEHGITGEAAIEAGLREKQQSQKNPEPEPTRKRN